MRWWANTWCIETSSEPVTLVQTFALSDDEREKALSPDEALFTLAPVVGGRDLEEFLEAESLPQDRGRGLSPLQMLESLLYSDEWTVVPGFEGKTGLHALPGFALIEEAAKLVGEQKAKKSGWIEIEVNTDDGEPYTGPFRLELPDKAVRSGSLGSSGVLSLDGIDPGACTFSLPALDDKAVGQG